MTSKVTIIPWYKNVCCGDKKPSSSLDTAQSTGSSSQPGLWWGSPRSLLTGLISERLATRSCTFARSLALFTRPVELVSAGVL